MRSVTPFFCMTASSSFCTSSNVKPYWKPEQPPPVTKTRSLRSGLPSSSISCFTLLAAPSLKLSGTGISAEGWVTASVTAFIALLLDLRTWTTTTNCGLSARGELQFYALRFRGVIDQPAFNHGALMDFDAFVV